MNNKKNEMSKEKKKKIYIICFIAVFLMGLFIIVVSNEENEDDGKKYLKQLDYMEESKLKTYAVEDILEIGNIWRTPSANELVCTPAGKTDDNILLSKCTTTFDELIQVYGSSTIWYGYLPSASGNSYWRAADADQYIVTSTLRDR